MATLKELAEKLEYLRSKVGMLEEILNWVQGPDSKLKEEFGERVHDEVAAQLEEFTDSIRQVIKDLEETEVSRGKRKGKKGKGKVPGQAAEEG